MIFLLRRRDPSGSESSSSFAQRREDLGHGLSGVTFCNFWLSLCYRFLISFCASWNWTISGSVPSFLFHFPVIFFRFPFISFHFLSFPFIFLSFFFFHFCFGPLLLKWSTMILTVIHVESMLNGREQCVSEPLRLQ